MVEAVLVQRGVEWHGCDVDMGDDARHQVRPRHTAGALWAVVAEHYLVRERQHLTCT